MKNKSEQSMPAASLDKLNLCKCSHWLALVAPANTRRKQRTNTPYPHSRLLLAPTEQGHDDRP